MSLRTLRYGALAVALLAGALPAQADLNVKDASNAIQTLCTTTFGTPSKHAYCHYLVDVNGVAFGTLANPFHTGLTFGGADLTLGQKASAGAVPTVLSVEQEAILTAVKVANGAPADPQYNGSNTATQIALLKAAVAQLGGTLTTAGSASEAHVGQVGGDSVVATASFVRPANATAYASGQLVANSTTAGSVTPLALTVARKAAGTGRITRLRLSDSNPLAGAATFRIHLFKTAPTSTAGDGGTFAGAVNGVASVYLGAFDVTLDKVFSDGAKGIGTVNVGAYISFDAAAGSQVVYALVEARSAYTPTSGETLTVAAEADRD